MRRLPLSSPPRMRGKGVVQRQIALVVGITPACAGKRCLGHLFQVELRDHPRVCGEKRLPRSMACIYQGSPPRVRGKGHDSVPLPLLHGITPACAGKRPPTGRWTSSPWDHPRVCGEKPPAGSGLYLILGSPPRMRGKVNLLLDGNIPLGITPAYAGKRPLTVCWRWQKRDHPRVCGEKMCIQCSKSIPQGSPPRVRGKAVPAALPDVAHGITPACAGKSVPPAPPGAPARDHPRVCGEKNACWGVPQTPLGSPPRMRGKAPTQERDTVVGGITPAYAGKSRPRPHPRRCLPSAPWHGGSHGCRGRAAAPKCPPPGSERYPFHPLR